MQTRIQSIVEAITNTIIGFLLGMAANYYVLPMLGFVATMAQAGGLTLIMTVISFARQYILRRVFNHAHSPKIVA